MSNFDFDLFIIGAGSGGVRAARFSSNFGAKVTSCLTVNTECYCVEDD